MAKNILIVDDEEIITKSLQKLLKKEGYGVIIANNGLDAVEKVKYNDFDLIVLDIRMPQMDGIETIKKIREFLKENGKASISEIVITGYADEGKYKNAIDLEVADYIYKPFEINDFLEAIKRNLK